jgi:hypothetical protein
MMKDHGRFVNLTAMKYNADSELPEHHCKLDDSPVELLDERAEVLRDQLEDR